MIAEIAEPSKPKRKLFQRIKPEGSELTNPKRSQAMTQIIDMQAVLYKKVMAGEGKVAELAQAARAWVEQEKLKRLIRMQPPPKAVEVESPHKRSKRSASQPSSPSFPSEPFEEPAPLKPGSGPVTPAVTP